MVPTLEAIKGGGGSVKVGTTGTISALMSRELESTNSASKEPSSIDEASCSKTSSCKNQKGTQNIRRTKRQTGSTNQIPMLTAHHIALDGTPIRQKPINKVEIVDLKCGNPNKTWANPITNRLKKLGFSKLSDTTV